MSLYEALLFLHVVSAFAFFAAYFGFGVALITLRGAASPDTARTALDLVRPANAFAWIGATGTIVFGVWLTLDLDGYDLVDGWILGAFALWFVAEEAIRREDLALRRVRRAAHAASTDVALRGLVLLYVVGLVAMLGVLALMIYKPGAP